MKVAIVTGGTSGIGREISKQFVLRGDKVIAIYASNDKKAMEAQQEINNKNFITKKLDVTNEALVKEFFATIPQIDYLINCAGTSILSNFEEQNIDEIKRIMDINLYGKMHCCKYAIPQLKKSSEARIINIASRFAQKPFMEGVMAYCCSMTAIEMMSRVLALELAKYGIRVNTVSPSLTITPLTTKLYTEDTIDSIESKNPSGRLGKVSDVANVVMFLCSERSDYINGENINANGGILLI